MIKYHRYSHKYIYICCVIHIHTHTIKKNNLTRAHIYYTHTTTIYYYHHYHKILFLLFYYISKRSKLFSATRKSQNSPLSTIRDYLLSQFGLPTTSIILISLNLYSRLCLARLNRTHHAPKHLNDTFRFEPFPQSSSCIQIFSTNFIFVHSCQPLSTSHRFFLRHHRHSNHFPIVCSKRFLETFEK